MTPPRAACHLRPGPMQPTVRTEQISTLPGPCGPAWMRKGMCGSRTTEEERVRLSRLSLHHDVPAGRAGATPAVVAVFPGEVGQLISGQALEIVDHGVGGRDSLSGGELLQIQRVTGVTLAVGQALLGLPGSLSPRAEGAGA